MGRIEIFILAWPSGGRPKLHSRAESKVVDGGAEKPSVAGRELGGRLAIERWLDGGGALDWRALSDGVLP
jgi:hypothetical protein